MHIIQDKLRDACAKLAHVAHLQWRYPPQEPDDPIHAVIDPSWPVWTNDPPFPLMSRRKCWLYSELVAPAEHCRLPLGRGDLLVTIYGWFPFTLWIDGVELFREEHLWKGTGPISEPIALEGGSRYRLVLCLEPGELPNLIPAHSMGAGPLKMGINAKPADRMRWRLEAAGHELLLASQLARTAEERSFVARAAELIDLPALTNHDWQAATVSIAAMESALSPVFSERAKALVVHLIGHTHLAGC